MAQINSHDWAISACFNANLANKLLVLIDGRAVYTPLYGGVLWNVQDYLLADIDRIEVISGPGSTLWGANAVNGVFNIITKAAPDTQGLYVQAAGGKELRDLTAARYGTEIAPHFGEDCVHAPHVVSRANGAHRCCSRIMRALSARQDSACRFPQTKLKRATPKTSLPTVEVRLPSTTRCAAD